MRPRRSARGSFLRIAGGVLSCLLAAPLTAAPVPTRDDLVALLEAGVGESVILKQLRASGGRLDLTSRDLVALKAAGASDALLEALMEEPPPEAPFRIYTAAGETGEPVLHITNLDELGRRIGGEVKDPAPVNVVAAGRTPDPREPDPEPYPYDDFDDAPDAAQAPVIVNVYPPEPAAAAPYAPPYAGGLYPGFPVGYLGGRHLHGPGCGHHALRRPWWLSPPGSYTHFLTYHHDAPAQTSVLHPGRPALIDTRPYTLGSAAARNRARSRRH